MQVLEICEIMGWDYFTYLAQPQWFLHLAHRKLEIDRKKANNKTPRS